MLGSRPTSCALLWFCCKPKTESKQVFLENPAFTSFGIPDLVVCDETEVLLVAEIKFVPHEWPEFKGDIAKCNTISSKYLDKKFTFERDPKTGNDSDSKCQITKDTHYVFFVVDHHAAEAVYMDDVEKELKGSLKGNKNFTLCYGIVNPDKENRMEFKLE